MAKPLAIIGGFLVIFGVVGGLFLEFMAWYNYNRSTTIFFITLTAEGWINAFGGTGGSIIGFEQELEYFSEEIVWLLPGILAGLGGLLLIIQNKQTSIIGGVLILIGLVIFIINLMNHEDLMNGIENLGGSVFYSSSDSENYYYLGVGFYITFVGGILGTIGGIKEE